MWGNVMKILKLAVSALVLASMPAQAATYLFSYTGDATASFKLDSNPTPDFIDTDFSFMISNVLVNFNGIDTIVDTYFYTLGEGGGFSFATFDRLDATSLELYTGTQDAPVFKLGTFQTTAFVDGLAGTGTLVISEVPFVNDVPEPASWAMLIAGFGLVGATMRRRRNAAVAA
jgi:hypothetical protein